MTKERLWKDFEFSLSNPWPQLMEEKDLSNNPHQKIVSWRLSLIWAKIIAYLMILTINFGAFLDWKAKKHLKNVQ